MEKLDTFTLYLVREGLASTTIEKDIKILKRLMQLEVLVGDKIEGFLFVQLQKGSNPSYLNTIILAARRWGRFLNDPTFQNIKLFKIKETNKSTLSDDEIEAFLKLPKPKQSKKDRYEMWNLFFKICAYSGMRMGEVANLTVRSLDFGRSVFILDRTKTTPRLVPIAPSLTGDLVAYIKRLDGDHLFLIDEKTLYKDQWNGHFQMRIKRMGIKRSNLSTYSLRHSFITRLLSEDVNIFKVQRIVGHKNLETTNHYTHLVTKDLSIALSKDPLGRKALSYNERFKQFREEVRILLNNLTISFEEEKQMLQDLIPLLFLCLVLPMVDLHY